MPFGYLFTAALRDRGVGLRGLEAYMLDVVLTVVMVVFYAVAIAYVFACERL